MSIPYEAETLSVQVIRPGGMEPTFEIANAVPYRFLNRGTEFVALQFGDTDTYTITLYPPHGTGYITGTNNTVTVGPGTTACYLGPYPADRWTHTDGFFYFGLAIPGESSAPEIGVFRLGGRTQ